MIPADITRQHVLRAVEQILAEGVPERRRSRRFDLVLDDGQRLPPKYVIAVAAIHALGRRLDSAEFGGGEETNGFLRGLGFTVESKGKPARKVPSPETRGKATSRESASARGGQVRVARAILNMGVTPSEFKARDTLRWAAHRKVVTDQFRRDPAAYDRRLVRLAERAAEEGAAILLLPACALVHDGRRSPIVDEAMAQLPCVATGCLELQRGADREYAEVRSRGVVLHAFDNTHAHWLTAAGLNLFVAISSTIKQVGHDGMVRSQRHAPDPARPALALDMGHDQYKGRYVRLLDGVRRRASGLHGGRRAAAILSYWKYRDTEPVSPWWKPEEEWISSSRIHVPWRDGEPGDLLDVVDLDLG